MSYPLSGAGRPAGHGEVVAWTAAGLPQAHRATTCRPAGQAAARWSGPPLPGAVTGTVPVRASNALGYDLVTADRDGTFFVAAETCARGDRGQEVQALHPAAGGDGVGGPGIVYTAGPRSEIVQAQISPDGRMVTAVVLYGRPPAGKAARLAQVTR
jgi:hypothetical protein